MTGEEFLKLASELFAPFVTGSKPANEALFRTIVGRAYYGAYHLASEFLEQLGFPTSTHGAPPEYLQGSREESARQAGSLLANFYQFRRRADYELTNPMTIKDCNSLNFVKDQIERAIKIKSLIAKCKEEPARSLIRAGIEAHRRTSGNSRNR